MQKCELCPTTDGVRPAAMVRAILAPLPGSKIATRMEDRALCEQCYRESVRYGRVIAVEVL